MSENTGWSSSTIPIENRHHVIYLNDNLIFDENDERDQPSEARAWSTYRMMNSENILGEGPTRQQKSIFSTSIHDQTYQSKEDIRGVERILSYIDQRRPPRSKKYRITWRTFIGTMSGMDQIYSQENFLHDFKEIRLLWIFMDSVFRGIGQVMFANNPLSGIIITIGLFIGNWELALYGLLGTSVSTFTAHLVGFNYNAIRSGLFGYNGCLTAMGIAYFSFPQSPQLIGPIILMCMFSAAFSMAIGKILVQRLELSPFTFSFQVCVWMWLLGALKYRYFFVNGTILSPGLLKTLIDKPSLSNITYGDYTAEDHFVGLFTSISQVYFIDNPYTGAIILIGVCLCSRILSFFALFGSVTGQLSAAYLFGLSASAIHSGLWGYNTVLTCQALGGMFFVLYGYRIWLLTFYGSIMTVILQAGLSSFLSACGMPTLTFPFTFMCWIFSLIAGSKHLIAVKLTAVSIPEDHYRRYRLSQLIKSQFKYIDYLTNISSAIDENQDITWEELSKIQKIYLPILMHSYIHINDFKHLKKLIKQNKNINFIDQNFRTPLHISVSQGNIRITKWLLKNMKLNINSIDKFGNTPLYAALWNGHFHLLPYLYSHGARFPAAKAKELGFYLNAFIYENNLEAIQYLTAYGFNPNGCDIHGQNALHLSVITNQYHLVKYLIEEYPIWLDIKDRFNQTAIDYAYKLSDNTILNYLLNHKTTNPIPTNIKKEKLKHIEIDDHDDYNNEEKLIKTIDECLFPTLFFMISAQKDANLMENFLLENPKLNILDCTDYDHRSIAHIAASEGRLDLIQYLHEHCQTRDDFQRIINREDRWNISPLDEAFRNRHQHIINFIHEKLSYQSNQINPTQQIIQLEPKTMTDLLKKWNKIYLFCSLAASGESAHIESLFNREFFLSTELYEDYHQRNPMHFAAANGHLNVIQILIKYKYKGIFQKNRWGFYPIDEARFNNFYHIVELLLNTNL